MNDAFSFFIFSSFAFVDPFCNLCSTGTHPTDPEETSMTAFHHDLVQHAAFCSVYYCHAESSFTKLIDWFDSLKTAAIAVSDAPQSIFPYNTFLSGNLNCSISDCYKPEVIGTGDGPTKMWIIFTDDSQSKCFQNQ